MDIGPFLLPMLLYAKLDGTTADLPRSAQTSRVLTPHPEQEPPPTATQRVLLLSSSLSC